MTAETMGQRLQRLRERINLSQPQFAAKAGVPVGTLRNWEQDWRLPSLPAAVRLAAALGVTVDELVAGINLDDKEPTPVPPPTQAPEPSSEADEVSPPVVNPNPPPPPAKPGRKKRSQGGDTPRKVLVPVGGDEGLLVAMAG